LAGTDHRYRRFIAVTLKKLGTVWEKRWIGEAVVFEDDPCLNVFEKPADRRTNGHFAAKIGIAVKPVDLAWPVDTGHGKPHIRTMLLLIRAAGTRTIRGDEQFPRPRLPDALKHTLCEVSPIEDQK
jgi:hypothetical protein